HDPIFTVEEAKKVDKMIPGKKCKNLFLKSSKENKYYVYILDEDKRADLKLLSKKIGSSRLSFASEEELYEYLKLTRGSVTPFGIINDTECKACILIDEELRRESVVNFHPNVNTSTIGISQNNLEKFIRFEQNQYYYV
ncbi:MAG TPA: prolyl-tRNA synthetase associated domain-containing protein, partial [Clostridium sp.]|nr:prolyl-tRNA synthetase associated domain-containing protein [Clostridium sp.]